MAFNSSVLMKQLRNDADITIYIGNNSNQLFEIMNCYKPFVYNAGNLSFINKFIHQATINQSKSSDTIKTIFVNQDYKIIHSNDDGFCDVTAVITNKDIILDLLNNIDKTNNINIFVDYLKEVSNLKNIKDNDFLNVLKKSIEDIKFVKAEINVTLFNNDYE